MALNAQVTMSLVAHESSAGDLSKTLRVTPASFAATLSDGVAWSASKTLSGSTQNISLSSLPDTRDGSPATVTMTAVKAVFVRNSGTANLTFAGGPFAAGGETLRPSASVLRCDSSASSLASSGVTVTGSTGCTYDIVLVGPGSVA